MFRKDKGQKRDKYKEREKNYQRIQTAKKIVGKASQLAIGAGLVTGGLLATKKLTNAGYLPKLIGKANDPLVKRSRDALKASMHEGATKSAAILIPATTLGATGLGVDYLIDRKHDMPVTKKLRKLSTGNFTMYLPNQLQSSISFSEFKRGNKDKLYSSHLIDFKRGRDKKKRKKKQPGLLSLKRKSSYVGHLSKGIVGGAVIGGGLSGLAASPMPLLVPAATAIGALDGSIKGGIAASAIYGAKKGLQERGRNKK